MMNVIDASSGEVVGVVSQAGSKLRYQAENKTLRDILSSASGKSVMVRGGSYDKAEDAYYTTMEPARPGSDRYLGALDELLMSHGFYLAGVE